MMNVKAHNYRIYYISIDLRHQYGIFAAETQTYLRAKRPHASGEERGETAALAGYTNCISAAVTFRYFL